MNKAIVVIDMSNLLFRYDRQRVEELGPDRACAEWVLRCGGSVRFKNWGSLISNPKNLPTGTPGQFQIEEIQAIKASISSEGFAYLGSFSPSPPRIHILQFLFLDGLTNLKKIHLENCEQVADSK